MTNSAGCTCGHCRVSLSKKTNFMGHCFEIAMKADTYWTTSSCRHFCKCFSCIISLNTLKNSLRQVLLPLFYILMWLSNWTKVTQLVIGRARIWAQAIWPQSLFCCSTKRDIFHFPIYTKIEGSAFKATLMKYSSLLPSLRSIQMMYSVTKPGGKMKLVFILYIKSFLCRISHSFTQVLNLYNPCCLNTKTKWERYAWYFYSKCLQNEKLTFFVETPTLRGNLLFFSFKLKN